MHGQYWYIHYSIVVNPCRDQSQEPVAELYLQVLDIGGRVASVFGLPGGALGKAVQVDIRLTLG